MAELYGFQVQHAAKVVFGERRSFETEMDKLDEERGTETDGLRRDELFSIVKDLSSFELSVDRKVGLRGMAVTDTLTQIFMDMNWSIGTCSDQHLVTSDNPIVRLTPPNEYHPIYGDGAFANKRTYVTVPLSASVILEMRWSSPVGKGMLHVPKQRGRLYNRQRAVFSERYLYASRNDIGIRTLGQKHRKPGLNISVSGLGNSMEMKIKRRLD